MFSTRSLSFRFTLQSSVISLIFSLLAHLVFAQQVIWSEDFSGYPNGTTADPPHWTTQYNDPEPDFWGVSNGRFCGTDTDVPSFWFSAPIALNCAAASVSVELLHEPGTYECSDPASVDFFRCEYQIDNGAWVQFATNGYVCGGFNVPTVASDSGLHGDTLRLRVTLTTKSNAETYCFDNVQVLSFPSQLANIGADQSLCFGDTAFLNETGGPAGSTWQWTYLGPNIGNPETLSCSTCSNPFIVPADTAIFSVLLTDTNGCVSSDTVSLLPLPELSLEGGNDTLICNGNSLNLQATPGFDSYLWTGLQSGFSDTSFSVTLTQNDTYVLVAGQGACVSRDTFQVGFSSPPMINLGPDTSFCDNFVLDATTLGSSYLWQDGFQGPLYPATQSGTYWVTVYNACDTLSDTVQLSQILPPSGVTDLDTAICGNDTLNLDVTSPGARYLWMDSTTAPTYQVTGKQELFVYIYHACDTVQHFFSVDELAIPQPDLGASFSLCPEETAFLDATLNGAIYVWEDGSNNPQRLVSGPGTYAITVTNACGSGTASIELPFGAAPQPIPDRAGIDCQNQEVVLNAGNSGASYLWSNGETGSEILVEAPGTYWVDITLCGSTLRESIEVIPQGIGTDALDFPNVFTPNNDGVNDEFQGSLRTELSEFELRVFNRWGKEVWSSNNPQKGWNGEQQSGGAAPNGTYFYTTRYLPACGDGTAFEKSGTISLLR